MSPVTGVSFLYASIVIVVFVETPSGACARRRLTSLSVEPSTVHRTQASSSSTFSHTLLSAILCAAQFTSAKLMLRGRKLEA